MYASKPNDLEPSLRHLGRKTRGRVGSKQPLQLRDVTVEDFLHVHVAGLVEL